ncbi:MAG: ABC transporter substrate-binding protein [Betaproteobacteria bacterium RIFCSPLOWO2_02_FULL_63_19]|nr:MAG: ABC transporter substrate-binding protein [Betaproteobacteria bacterium RIFCSPLOWO2_02_FULL_63_19]
MTKKMMRAFVAPVILLSVSVFADRLQAQEVVLSGVSAFAQGTTFSTNFERFIKKANEIGKGKVKINYRGGGGKVMDPFQLGDAIRTGVVDIGNLPGAFYTKLVPEVDAIKLSQFTIAEERKNGAWAYMNDLHERKMNAHHLARQKECAPFHLYLTKPISKPDLKGFKIRVTPIYRAFFADMGANLVRTAPGEVYTALERGTVDGYGWPTQGVLDLGWHEVTKFRVDPGFYRASVEVLINLDKWKTLNAAQKQVLRDASAFLETTCQEDEATNVAEKKRQANAGIKTITFSGREGDAYVKRAYDTGWAEVIKANPQTGPKLRELLSKK